MRYLVVVEQGPTSFGAYVPDLPGCVAAGETKAEALKLIREAIARGSIRMSREALVQIRTFCMCRTKSIRNSEHI